MTPLDFGKQLRAFRLQCRDLKTGKTLSQQQLGEFLYEQFGVRYSGAAVSDWERNESKINVSDRSLLINIIKILRHHGGIKTLSDANLLLETGGYRALNTNEKLEVFSEGLEDTSSSAEYLHHSSLLLLNFPMEFEKILAAAREGPPPIWPRVFVASINRITRQWTIFHVLGLLAWLWIWLISYLMVVPSLQWPFGSPESARHAMWFYVAGSILIPLLISVMVTIKSTTFWQEKRIPTLYTLRLFIYQGASIGYHVGYFVIFAFSLAQYYFHTEPTIWIEAIKTTIPLFTGYAGAHLVPHNLWRAYERLHLKDGGIFFVFIILGPLWALFFLKFYEILITQKLGIIFILLAATLLASAMAIQYRRKGVTTIPILWVFLLYGSIFICQLVSLFFP